MDLQIAFQEALDYIYKFVDYSLTRNLRYSPEKFDLSRMEHLLHLLGDPHRKYGVVHVAGTKGKGSTSAMIASVLQEAGYRVGFYTSPHLHEYTERIQVNRQPISMASFVALLDSIKPIIEQVERITTFEITTALAFLYFAQEKVDYAVVEVGLGGRLDATNLVEPIVSVITSLSYDHMNVLGDTLAKIAGEKAGIIKQGHPVVVSPQQDEALQVVEKIAAERNAPVRLVGREVHFIAESHSLDGQVFRVWSTDSEPLRLEIPLLGGHQIENAAAAYAAIQVLQSKGIAISLSAIRSGFAKVQWSGRFEILRREPPIVIDSAHNRDSARRLRMAITDYFPDRRLVLLFGASEDKDIAGMFAELLPGTSELIATQSVHPRAAAPEQLVKMANEMGYPARVVMPLEQALIVGIEAASTDGILLATGSLFIAAAVRDAWQQLPLEIQQSPRDVL
ncbi:MAG TPA: folylpolyglutamate synthase/dihydrofolate synthase family protein [Anaerolineaceae bacterium]